MSRSRQADDAEEKKDSACASEEESLSYVLKDGEPDIDKIRNILLPLAEGAVESHKHIDKLVHLSSQAPETFASRVILESLVSVLNSSSSAPADRERCLAILANVAGVPKKRQTVLEIAQEISDSFEATLEREEGGEYSAEEPEQHKLLIILLCRASGYKIAAQDILEIVRGDEYLGLGLVVSLMEQAHDPHRVKLLKVGKIEPELVSCWFRLLAQFSQPGTYFSEENGSKEEKLERDVTPSGAMHSVEKFANKMEQLLNLCIRTELFRTIGYALEEIISKRLAESDDDDSQEPFLSLREGETLVSALLFLENLHRYSAVHTEEMCEEIVHTTSLITLLPQLLRRYIAFDTKQQDVEQGLKGRHIQVLLSVLKFFIIISYSAPESCAILGRENITSRFFSTSPVTVRRNPRLLTLLLMYNVNLDAFNVESFNDISADAEEKEESVSSSQLEECSPGVLFASCIDSILAQGIEYILSLLRQLQNSASLPLSRGLISYMLLYDILSTLASDALVQEEIKLSAPSEMKETLPNDVAVSAQQASKGSKEAKKNFRLLGDLPPFVPYKSRAEEKTTPSKPKVSEKQAKREASNKSPKASATRGPQHADHAALSNVPERFKCALTGSMMKMPMKSPYGDHFEKSSIEAWIAGSGKQKKNICPITQRRLTKEELVEDKVLQTEILNWHIQQVVEKTHNPQMDTGDLYDF